ncbi:MAG: TRAP transporter small permease subunit [Alphaproteobacteria bacterium]|nr:TRAP transporter small permease subunit [Alphaproteobacteria bacterium]
MNGLLNLAEYLDRIPRFIGKCAGFIVLPLIAVIMFDVITRKIDFLRIGMSQLSFYWLIEPIKLQDMEWHLHAIILMLSFGYGYLMNSHVRVDIFREMLSRRGQAWVEFWGVLLLAIPYLVIAIYFSFIFVWISFQQGEGSESLTGITHRYIIKSVMVIGFTLTFGAFMATFIRLCALLFGGHDHKARAAESLDIFTTETNRTADVLAAEARTLAKEINPKGGER